MHVLKIILFAVGLLLGAPAHANYCSKHTTLALVLALDSSGSIKRPEWLLQRAGYADAFRHSSVVNAILTSGCGVAVTVVQWSGADEQMQVIPWQTLDNPGSIEAFAAHLERMEQVFNQGTSIGGAIHFSLELFKQLRVLPMRKVIDISGDGYDKTFGDYDDYLVVTDPKRRLGEPGMLSWEREEAAVRGVTINGVSIQSFASDPGDTPDRDMFGYYNRAVKTPDGFVLAAHGFEDFGRAIRQKIVIEIALLN